MTGTVTGQRAADVRRALRHWGDQAFSVYAGVVRDGQVRVGDKVQVI